LAEFILDTNVLFSAARGEPTAAPARIVASVLNGTRELLFSEALLDEYLAVLLRPKAMRWHQLATDDVANLIGQLKTFGRLVSPRIGPPCPDPDDQLLWDLLATVSTAILVTGEHALLRSNHFPGRVLSPREFLERFDEPL
jgi:predicted nucleic acid-binding protein